MDALERKALACVTLFFVLSSLNSGVSGHTNNATRPLGKMYYVCPPEFVRLGSSCYYFSDTKATWQNALFACKDRDSNLTVPARWEDRRLREYLNNPQIAHVGRWIGGIYDYGDRIWKWGGEMRTMKFQSFSRMKKLTPEELQWHCIAMMPELFYRWAARSCVEPRPYICKTRLQKVRSTERNELKRRWSKLGLINEITAPSVDRRGNFVTAHPLGHPKSYDLRPNELRKRDSPNAHRRLKPPFPGYKWNRRNPEAAYSYNAELLRSGKTGLSPAQVNHHLRRLKRLRNKQLRRRRMRMDDEWLSADAPVPASDALRPSARRLSAARHQTYTVDNTISALHPKLIVEVHDFGEAFSARKTEKTATNIEK